jgi:putative phosphoesterase
MRIAAVSDTHLPRFGRRLPRALVDGIRDNDVELLLHAGDWTEPLAVDLFEELAAVEGVAGNNDSGALQDRFGSTTRLVADGIAVGITHGHLGAGRTTRERALQAFTGERLDLIVFGHSHQPHIERLPHGGWLVNPGSPTDRRSQPRFTWLLLETTEHGLLEPRLVAFDDRRV